MIELKHVNYKYPSGGNENSLTDFNLQIETGEFVVLCGESGCGKTTVTRLINGLIPHFHEGTLTGEVTIDSVNVTKSELSQTAKIVGSVFQNPRTSFIPSTPPAKSPSDVKTSASLRQRFQSV